MKKGYLLLMFSFPLLLLAQTYIDGGDIGGEWFNSGSPYIITDDIRVPADSNLIIHNGVDVLFEKDVKMVVHGGFKALGTSSDSIVFSASNVSDKWLGIIVSYTPSNNDSIQLEYCHFEHATGKDTVLNSFAFGALYLQEVPKIGISYCSFRNNKAFHKVGAGIASYYSPVKISNSIFVNNEGITIKLYHSDAYINECTISHNHNNYNTAGISAELSAPRIMNSEISYNESHGGTAIDLSAAFGFKICGNIVSDNKAIGLEGGAGIKVKIAKGLIRNNYIMRNVCEFGSLFHPRGGGIYLGMETEVNIVNNQIIDNIAHQGSGLYIAGANAVLTNNLIYGNGRDGSSYGSGVAVFNSTLNFYNNIVFDNIPENKQVYCNDNNQDLSFYNSCVEGGIDFIEGIIIQDVIQEYPEFVNPVDNDFHLRVSSPCINSGLPDTTSLQLPEKDLDGNPRIYNRIVDMGVFENQTVNHSPLTINDSLHFILEEDFGMQQFYLDTLFEDDAGVRWLDYELLPGSTSNCFDATFNDGYLQLYSADEAFGFDTLHIKATDDFGLSTEAIVFFETTEVDDPPLVVNPVPDLRLKMNAPDSLLDLQHTFSDIDNPDSLINIEIAYQSNPDLVSATLLDKELLLSITPDAKGFDTLVILAHSSGLSCTDTFTVEVFDPSGVEELQEGFITVFPNPTYRNLHINFNHPVLHPIKVEVLKLNGQVIKEVIHSVGEAEIIIDMNTLEKGIYLIRIYAEGKMYTRKVLKF